MASNVARSVTIFTTVACFLTSCVTSTPSQIASKNGTFKLSCSEDGAVAAKKVALIKCDVTNLTDRQVEVEVERLAMPSSFSGKIVSATGIRRIQEQQNEDGKRALIGLLVVTAAAIGGRGSSGTVGAGGVAAIAALPSGKRNVADESSDAALEAYGEQHLLGGRFLLGAGETKSKSALFSLGRESVPPRTIDVCFAKPTAECLTTTVESWPGRARLRSDEVSH